MSAKSLTISTTAGDCWGGKVAVGSFDNTSDRMWVGGTNSTGEDPWNWIPFVVPFAQGKKITSATIRLTATLSRADLAEVNIGCEAADNASAPVSNAQLRAKTLTTAYNFVALDAMTDGVTYGYDVTTAVQEVLNRAGWATNNTLAVMIQDTVAGNVNRREVATFEHATYTEPQLVIVYEGFVPRSSGLIKEDI